MTVRDSFDGLTSDEMAHVIVKTCGGKVLFEGTRDELEGTAYGDALVLMRMHDAGGDHVEFIIC